MTLDRSAENDQGSLVILIIKHQWLPLFLQDGCQFVQVWIYYEALINSIISRKGEYLDAGRSAWANVHRCATALVSFWEGWCLVHWTHPFLGYNIAQEMTLFKMGFCLKYTKESCGKGRICFGKVEKRWQDSWEVLPCIWIGLRGRFFAAWNHWREEALAQRPKM